MFSPVIEQTLRSKFLCSLVGTAVGDSLGVMFEECLEVGLKEIEATAEKLWRYLSARARTSRIR